MRGSVADLRIDQDLLKESGPLRVASFPSTDDAATFRLKPRDLRDKDQNQDKGEEQ